MTKRILHLFANLPYRAVIARVVAFARGGLRFTGRRRVLETAARIALLALAGAAVVYAVWIVIGILAAAVAWFISIIEALVITIIGIVVLWFGGKGLLDGATSPGKVRTQAPQRDLRYRYSRPVDGPPPGSKTLRR